MPLSWDAFLVRYGPMARALARSLARPPADPEDLVQEAALALYRALAREPERFPRVEDARGYFLAALRNQARRTHRGARPEALAAEPAAPEVDAAVRTVRRRQEALGRLLLELPPEERELVRRRFLERETLASVAAATGVPVSTLHSREKALLARLRERLERLEREARA